MQPLDAPHASVEPTGSIRQIGPYKVIRKIGAGGMGDVYEARHATIERRVAIKVLRPTLAQNPELNTRFINEARAVNIVDHPGIVQIFDYGRLSDGTAYIVMEYLHGVTLSRHMGHPTELLPLEDVLRFSRQIASILAAAHAKGIVHRDLKPDNVMLIPDPELDDPLRIRLKLLDFGVAKLGNSLSSGGAATHNSLVVGTPEYMSPEQCRNSGKVTAKADVYSLGVILFELLTGKVPFTSDSATELMAKHMYEPLPPLPQLAPDAPEPLVRLVRQMLDKQAERRPSMGQVQLELEQIAAQLLNRSGQTRPSRPPIVISGREPEVLRSNAPTTAGLVGSSDSAPMSLGRLRSLIVAAGGLGLFLLALWSLAKPPVPVPVPVPAAPGAGASNPTAPVRPAPPSVDSVTAPASPPAAASVRWSLTTEPPGAQVIRVDTEEMLGVTPWHGEFVRGTGAIVVRIQLMNYESRIIPLSRSTDGERHERMQPLAAAVPRAQEAGRSPSDEAKLQRPTRRGKSARATSRKRIEEPEVEE